MNIAELNKAEVPLQDRLKRIFDDAGGSDTLVDLLAEFGFSGNRELADVITAAIAYHSGQLVERGEPVDLLGHTADAVRDACRMHLGAVISFDASRKMAEDIMLHVRETAYAGETK